jgi:dihydrofolate reductase
MKEIKLLAPVSIDGYSSRINGDTDWVHYEGDDFSEYYGLESFFKTIDRIVMNRMQYMGLRFQKFTWPVWEKPYYILAGKGEAVMHQSDMHGYAKLLTLDVEREENDLDYIRQMQKSSDEGAIWVMGDYRLTAGLLQNGMVDEINILRLPVTLGSGISFLAGFGVDQNWKLDRVSDFPNGAVLTRYLRAEGAEGADKINCPLPRRRKTKGA